MGITIQNQFTVQTPQLIDDRTCFSTVSDALLEISSIRRAIGLTVFISSEKCEYWFRDGVADSDFIIKAGGSPSLPSFLIDVNLSAVIDSSAIFLVTALTPLDQTTPTSDVKIGSLIIDPVGRFGVISSLLLDSVEITTISVPSSDVASINVIDNLTSTSSSDPLAARQGTQLMGMLMKPEDDSLLNDLIEDLVLDELLIPPAG